MCDDSVLALISQIPDRSFSYEETSPNWSPITEQSCTREQEGQQVSLKGKSLIGLKIKQFAQQKTLKNVFKF